MECFSKINNLNSVMSLEHLKVQTENWKAMKFWHSYRDFPPKPRLNLAIITCMDSRLISDIFGLNVGDALVIRNAGNRITADTLRSLLLGVYELGVRRILICGHTSCGTILTEKRAEEIFHKVSTESKIPTDVLIRNLNGKDSWSALGAIDDVHENVRAGLEALQQSKMLPNSVELFGAVYHVETGETEFLGG
ncbi:MAG: beta-class carbonic anhydrase [Candidatus Heimdallarchaeota archaeon]